jgi:carotenoid cleavage dioxygenase-like enzyme
VSPHVLAFRRARLDLEPGVRAGACSLGYCDFGGGLSDTPGELPRMDERLTGRPYRHGCWATQSRPMPQAPMYDGVAHIDLATGATEAFVPGDGSAFGERAFVPRSSGAAEGDGFVLSLVYQPWTRTSRLMIFNADSIAAGSRAHSALPVRVPNVHRNYCART